jgi:hypothetical protein
LLDSWIWQVRSRSFSTNDLNKFIKTSGIYFTYHSACKGSSSRLSLWGNSNQFVGHFCIHAGCSGI